VRQPGSTGQVVPLGTDRGSEVAVVSLGLYVQIKH
jgi:hypothetical protein